LFGWELFEKDKVYEILNIDENYIVLDHNLYANEYAEQPFDFVNKNFTKIIWKMKNKLYTLFINYKNTINWKLVFNIFYYPTIGSQLNGLNMFSFYL